ncbi:FMN-dependent NADH-azoreductase [Agaribacterium haliotis]|uniref:FMN-dependent NADH-azoreductase n=1 Tax=Agaribacterium haliotis TaxID=2013869 RepID=UPI000BB55A27|nr:NAD(P)H-dependent oxidoreductase [Agaribacterium haliotis]
MNILRIDSSITGEASKSSQLSAHLSQQLQQQHQASERYRNVAAEQLPHFDGSTLAAIAAGEAKLADELIAEVTQADVIIIAAPMYNFGISSQLKAWFDHIARAGETFAYTSEGPKGLLTGKKTYVVSTAGGKHKGKSSDLVTPYVKQMLSFVGLDDAEFIYAEGLAMSDFKDSAIGDAKAQIEALVETLAA